MNKAERRSAAGVVPEGWDVVPFSQFVSIQRGHDLTARQRRNGSVPVMGSAGLNGFHDTAIQAGPGMVLGRSGASYGQAHWCETDFWPHNTALYVTDFLGNDPKFAFYLLRATDFSQHNSGGAQQSLNRNFIAGILLARPPRPEQELIRRCLDDAEAVVAELERVIAKKRLIKQGAMQDLLTARRRLPGFSGEWDMLTILDAAHVDPEALGAGTPKGYGFRYISLEDVNQGVLSGWTDVVFGSAPSRARRILRKDDVLLGTVRPNLKSHLLFDRDGEDWIGSTGFAVLRPHAERCIPGYLFELIMSDAIGRQIDEVIAGSNYPAISNSDIRKLKIMLPSIGEQQAIAGVLRDMDAEIQTLESRLAKARAVKEGMMQNLLTGRVRLV